MLEQTLKNLAAQGFEVEWRYIGFNNSIGVKITKPECGGIVRYLTFDELRIMTSGGFEFGMNQVIKGMVQKIEDRE